MTQPSSPPIQPTPPPTPAPPPPAKKGSPTGLMVVFVLGLTAMLVGFRLFDTPTPAASVIVIPPPIITPASSAILAPTVSPFVLHQPLTSSYHVGIVSGHKGNDSGAVCDDGLTEASVNYAVATEVVSLLNRRGITTDLLDEFDPRLTEYKADALISIHADSCMVAGASGFKVARVTESAIPEAEDRLVACLYQEYGRYTAMPTHPASITDNMTNYHAFREISHQTPGAIIELGFLLDDRPMLEHKPKILARGVAAGILCFLEK